MVFQYVQFTSPEFFVKNPKLEGVAEKDKFVILSDYGALLHTFGDDLNDALFVCNDGENIFVSNIKRVGNFGYYVDDVRNEISIRFEDLKECYLIRSTFNDPIWAAQKKGLLREIEAAD